MDPRGKRALVTGGAVRVGRAISLALAEAGAAVVVHHHHSAAEAAELVDHIRREGGSADTLAADLSSMDEVRKVAAEAATPFGPIDILVNNASIFPEEGFEEVDEEVWERTLAINLRAPFFLTQAIGGEMKKRGQGIVLNLGDLAGIQAWSGYAAHGISKAGIVQLTRVAARALAPEVRVMAIAPGTVLPPESMSGAEVARLAQRTPLKRNGSPADVVEALMYAITSDFVTGQTLVVDGGRLLQ